MVTIEQIKQLREETAVSLQDCRKALEEASGDLDKAKQILREWGKDMANKRAGRGTEQGLIVSYIHPNKRIGVLLEVGCETDFVAKSVDFQTLTHELSLQIAAMGEETPLLEQAWVKDQGKTIAELLNDYIVKTGENIEVKRFTRYEI